MGATGSEQIASSPKNSRVSETDTSKSASTPNCGLPEAFIGPMIAWLFGGKR
jgi:hypothetical protein